MPAEAPLTAPPVSAERFPFRVKRAFTLHSAERRLLLILLDLTLINFALLASLVSSRGLPLIWLKPTWFLVLSVLWLMAAWAVELYDLRLAGQPRHSAFEAAKVAAIVGVVYFLIPHLPPSLPTSRLPWAVFVLLAVALLCIGRLLYAFAVAQPYFAHRTIIVGVGSAGQTICQAMLEYFPKGHHVVGFVDDDPKKQRRTICGVSVIGRSSDLLSQAAATGATQVIMAITHNVSDALFRALLECQERGIEIILMPVLYEQLTGKVAVEHIGRRLHLLLPLTPQGIRPFYLVFKQLVDLTAGALGMVLVGLIAPALWLLNRMVAPGPLFYRQTRVGQGGRTFELIKFRTMVPDAEAATGAIWAQSRDPRVTEMGNFLRRTRIDELPQLWNVLKGEMSLVGPRPERPEFMQQLDQQIPFYRLRHSVKPGVTGWAQIHHPYANNIEDSKIKVQYDLYYVKNRSVNLELLILLRTVSVVLRFQGM